MNNKNIIIAGAVAIGIYLFSQAKKIPFFTEAQKTAQRRSSATTSTVRQRTAQKIGKIIGKKVAQKVGISRLPVAQIRYMISHAAALKKTGKEVAVLKAELARRVVAWKAAQKVAQKGVPQLIHWRRREEATRRAVAQAKAAVPINRLFSGAEKSRIIPYSESSKHSYYGPKSHKLQNEGYMVEWQKRHYNSIEAYDDRKERYVLSHPELWKK